MISGMITGGILGRYEAAFSAMPLLVTFIPMLTDTGGNAGSQSSTLVIRGMAVGEIRLRDFARFFWKELRVSMLVGAALSTVNYVRLILTYPGQTATALTVAAALFVTVLLAKTVGGVLSPWRPSSSRPTRPLWPPPSSPPLWTPSPWWSTSTSPALCCPLHEKIPVRIGGQGFFSFSSPCPGAHPRSP